MSNLSSFGDLTLAQHEIDDLWRSINNSPSDPVSYWVSIASFIFAALGTISNLMSVIVLIRLSAQLSTFVYLTGLSLSDMITCMSIIINHTLEYIFHTRRSTSLTMFLRYVEIIFGALAAGSRVLSLWISTAVTMDRWILICYPIYGKTFCTLSRAKIVSGTLFIIAFIYSVPLFFEYEIIQMPSVDQMFDFNNQSIVDDKIKKDSMLVTKGYSDLAKRRLYRWAYMFFNAIFVYTLPTITIVFFNLQLIRALHRLKSRTKRLRQKNKIIHINNQHNRRSQQSKYSVTIMVIVMVLTLLICRSPTIVLWVLWSFELTIKIFFDSASSSGIRRFHNIANLIAIINAATNFLPFCVFGQLFRSECLNVYCCRKPSSEQLVKQAKRKHEVTNQRLKSIVSIQAPLTTRNDHLQTIPSVNSETTSGMTSSVNHSSSFFSPTNIVRLSDTPFNPTYHGQKHSKTSLVTTSLLKETTGL